MEQSDKQNRVFLVVGIEESEEAPHAIENSKRVYVRTGSAETPYDLADVNLIIDLVKRRKEPLELAERIAMSSEERAHLNIPSNPLHAASPKPRFVQINTGQRFPRQALCSTQEIWDFVSRATYRGGRFSRVAPSAGYQMASGVIPGQGANNFGAGYSEISQYGVIMARQALPLANQTWNGVQDMCIPFSEIFHAFLRSTVCAEPFYARFGCRGTLLSYVALENEGNTLMRFDSDAFTAPPIECSCFANTVSAQRIMGVEELGS